MADKILIQAIAYALSRKVVPSDEYYNKMTPIQRRQAVSIAGLAELEQVRYVIGKVNEALKDGKSFEEFQKSVKAKDIELPRYRLQTIYRTNIQQAYAHGRWHQQQADKRKKPYLVRDEINDSRTRKHHAEPPINGLTRHIDDPIWQYYYAPDEINCRGVMRAITKKEAKKRGITSDDNLPDTSKSSGWGTPADYNKRFNNLVKDRISEMMLEHTKQASIIKRIGSKITNAVSKFLSKPIVSLAVLIAEAKLLLEDEE